MQRYIFKPYSLIIRFRGGVVAAEINNDGTMRGSDVRQGRPALYVLRFWTEKALCRWVNEKASDHQVYNLKRETPRVFSCNYYGD